jgi:hypothetical protein
MTGPANRGHSLTQATKAWRTQCESLHQLCVWLRGGGRLFRLRFHQLCVWLRGGGRLFRLRSKP